PRPAGERTPQLRQFPLTVRIVLQQGYPIHEVVAGSTVHLPVVRQSLTVSEDLLDMDGEGAMTGRQQAFDPPSQPPAIGPRVGQTTDMADAQAVNETVLNEVEYLPVGSLDYLRQFRPQGHPVTHIEEAAPVDIVIGGAPVRQPVV